MTFKEIKYYVFDFYKIKYGQNIFIQIKILSFNHKLSEWRNTG